MVKENYPPCISGEQEDFRLLYAAFVGFFFIVDICKDYFERVHSHKETCSLCKLGV